MKAGDKVKFIEATIEQIRWGSNDDPNLVCEVGATYEVEKVEVHSWHTKIWLKGIPGKFNNASFEIIK